MDTPETIAHVSLCAGYGGIDLGLKRAIPSLRTIAFSEIEAFACANLVAKMEAGLMDAAPIWTDVKTFPWTEFRDRVDILSGGYPCQPFSSAGKRLGESDPRHLWPFIADGIARMRPRICFFENVEGHITLGLRNVLQDLAGMGYRATWGIFSASEVGAPHQRKRVFILAYRDCDGFFSDVARATALKNSDWAQDGVSGADGELADVAPCGVWPSRPGQPQHEWEPPRVVGNAPLMQRNGCDDNTGSGERPLPISKPRDAGWAELANTEGAGEHFRPQSKREAQSSGAMQHPNTIRQTQPALGRDADGLAGGLDYALLCRASDNRTDELRLLGNGVVPATAERAFRVLCKRLLT